MPESKEILHFEIRILRRPLIVILRYTLFSPKLDESKFSALKLIPCRGIKVANQKSPVPTLIDASSHTIKCTPI